MVKEISVTSKKPLILHCCCAICALPFIEFFNKKTNFQLILYFDNPNIYPQKEYFKRLENLEKVADIYHLDLKKGVYDHQKWLNYLKKNLPQPPKNYPENNLRCEKCFQYRILKTVNFCLKNNYLNWTTTLSVSRFKNTLFINSFAQKISLEKNLKYLKLDLDPFISYKEAKKLSETYHLYRQKYCGCEFSLNENKS
ncbi:MAG: epoxyqueuosine reductase QueH [Candidatus Paceibacterota bacterium]